MAGSGGDFILVAAIDFGTTFSGYAFSFRATKSDSELHEKIRTNKNWGASLGFQSSKCPTSVLTSTSGKFLAFGYDAEEMYGECMEESDGSKPDMLLFRNFKMMLHKSENVNSKATITSVDGTIRRALAIFAHAIRYLKDHLLEAITLETGNEPGPDFIRWVITVPAIWSDNSKQFMREAAFLAGCIREKDSRNLVIALEPEAASLCCRRLGIAQYATTRGIQFPAATIYMVLDCGGGTIDITIHKMQSNGKVKEVLRASGGPWGGTKVDRNFIELMEEALGHVFINTFIKSHPHEWLQFLTNFEKSKKKVKNDGTSKITVAPPFTMSTLFAEMNKGKRVDKHLKEGSCDGVTFGNGMIVINNSTAQALFAHVIETILHHTQKLLQDPKTNGLSYIFMVGGFSECHLLQDAIRKRFEGNELKVLVPSEAQLAIIKGAVLYGHQPEEIECRISRYSYGFEYNPTFNPKIHDKARKIVVDEANRCRNAFACMVQAGDEMETGKVIKKLLRPATVDATDAVLPLFAKDGAPNTPVQYTDERGMKQIGHVIVKLSGFGSYRKAEISFKFGGTELQVEARDVQTGEFTSTRIDFLRG